MVKRVAVASVWLSAALAMGAAGCGPILHAEMLTSAITSFSRNLKASGNDKIWVTSPADSACDRGCADCGKGGAAKGGGLFGGFAGPKDGSGPYDRLAYEVFSNYLVQKKKARVVEAHRHNYATELGTESHRKIELITEKVSSSSCEDLCMIDEAKKRKADKVLVYHILEMSNDKAKIHFRLSSVSTGVVEAAYTIKVDGLRARDESFGELWSRGGTSSGASSGDSGGGATVD